MTSVVELTAIFSGRPKSSEQRLAWAVLLRTFQDATHASEDLTDDSFVTPAEQADARAFLLGLCEGLAFWCDGAGLPIDRVINTARDLQRAGWQRTWRRRHAADESHDETARADS